MISIITATVFVVSAIALVFAILGFGASASFGISIGWTIASLIFTVWIWPFWLKQMEEKFSRQ